MSHDFPSPSPVFSFLQSCAHDACRSPPSKGLPFDYVNGVRCILILPSPSQICKHLSTCARPARVRQARRNREDDHTPLPTHPVTPRVRSHESWHRRAGWAGRQSLRRRRARVGLYTPYYVLRFYVKDGKKKEERRRREVEIPCTTTSCEREEFASGFLSRTMDLYFMITRAIDFPPPHHSPLPIPQLPFPPLDSRLPSPLLLPWVSSRRHSFVLLGLGFGTYSRSALLCHSVVTSSSAVSRFLHQPPLTLTSLCVSACLWFLVSGLSDSARYCPIVSCSSRLYFKKMFPPCECGFCKLAATHHSAMWYVVCGIWYVLHFTGVHCIDFGGDQAAHGESTAIRRLELGFHLAVAVAVAIAGSTFPSKRVRFRIQNNIILPSCALLVSMGSVVDRSDKGTQSKGPRPQIMRPCVLASYVSNANSRLSVSWG